MNKQEIIIQREKMLHECRRMLSAVELIDEEQELEPFGGTPDEWYSLPNYRLISEIGGIHESMEHTFANLCKACGVVWP